MPAKAKAKAVERGEQQEPGERKTSPDGDSYATDRGLIGDFIEYSPKKQGAFRRSLPARLAAKALHLYIIIPLFSYFCNRRVRDPRDDGLLPVGGKEGSDY